MAKHFIRQFPKSYNNFVWPNAVPAAEAAEKIAVQSGKLGRFKFQTKTQAIKTKPSKQHICNSFFLVSLVPL